MSKSDKLIVAVAILAVLVIGVATTVALVNKINSIKIDVPSVGAAGDSWSSQKIAQVEITTATTTIGSLYNGDARDRVISEAFYKVNVSSTSAFSPNVVLQVTTSTIAYGTSSASYVLNTNWSTSTSAINVQYVMSSTPGLTATYGYRIWKAGSYLNFAVNSVASNTFSGVVGVRYFSSN